MAENQERKEPKEREIPVFTVLKNNCILKNIFLLDNPPSIPSSSILMAENVDQQKEMEEILLVGRHPDCHIKLEHPSISRFHLRIHSKPSSRSLLVTDLSSVHGTWVSDRRIEPGFRTEVNEGDILKLGASSRLYRLNWIPLSRAYDTDSSFVYQLDASGTVDEETEGAMDQDENSVPCTYNQGQGLSDNVEGLERLLSNKDTGLYMQRMRPTAPPISEDLYQSFPNKDEVENNRSPGICNKENELSSSQLCQLNASVIITEETKGVTDQDGDSLPYYKSDEQYGLGDDMEGLERLFSDDDDLVCSMQKMSATTAPMPVVDYNSSPEICYKENKLSSSLLCQTEKENSTRQQPHILSTVSQKVSQAETTEYSLMHSDKGSGLSIWSRRSKPVSAEIETSRRKGSCARISTNSQIKSVLDGNCLSESMLKDEYVSPENDDEIFTPDKENTSPNSYLVRPLKCKFEETLNSESISISPIFSVDQDEEILTPDRENVTPNSHLLGSMKNIGGFQEVKLPSKENTSPNSYLIRSLKCKFGETLNSESISNTPISNVNQDEEIFTPDKENVTPNSHLIGSVKNIGGFQEVKLPNSHRPSPLKITNNMYQEEVTLPTLDKTSQHQKVLQESISTISVSKNHGSLKEQPSVLKARADRESFHPLPENSACDHTVNSIPSFHQGTMRDSESNKYPNSEAVYQSRKNTMKVSQSRWIIIADTTCLINRTSRKELQLLRGLRGTTLVIPRIVVRELDCKLKRASFLSRMTEALAALNWIEECMAATKWWIHVQSSAEEGRLVPPTPPATSHDWFGEEKSTFSVGSIPFSPYTLQEIVTPTSADHILECALSFRQTTNGQLVLLSDDVTLKIKAMAEGLICETAEEFRQSLVNPFSTRFLYSNSSPIGPTWSCVDDTVLKEKYYPSPSKNSKSGEGVKGLKLILLHNSNFRQMTS